LKTWDGDLLATQHFMVSSRGEAVKHQFSSMGRYTLARNIVMYDDCPVYKHEEQDRYLYRNMDGVWVVGPHNRTRLTNFNPGVKVKKSVFWEHA
jgi:hypothetical protein